MCLLCRARTTSFATVAIASEYVTTLSTETCSALANKAAVSRCGKTLAIGLRRPIVPGWTAATRLDVSAACLSGGSLLLAVASLHMIMSDTKTSNLPWSRQVLGPADDGVFAWSTTERTEQSTAFSNNLEESYLPAGDETMMWRLEWLDQDGGHHHGERVTTVFA